jgi:hypothetical protein
MGHITGCSTVYNDLEVNLWIVKMESGKSWNLRPHRPLSLNGEAFPWCRPGEIEEKAFRFFHGGDDRNGGGEFIYFMYQNNEGEVSCLFPRGKPSTWGPFDAVTLRISSTTTCPEVTKA